MACPWPATDVEIVMRNAFIISLLGFLLLLSGCGAQDEAPMDNNPDPSAPYFNSIGTPTELAGEPINFTVVANDPNGMNLTLSYDGNLGPNLNPFSAGASFDTFSGNFTWATDVNDAGTYSVRFIASNNAVPPQSSHVDVTIRVLDLMDIGRSLYTTHCQSCHGVNGAGGSASLVQCSTEISIREALGLVQGVNGVGAMSGIAGQLDNPTTDIQAIAYFLQNVNPTPNFCGTN
jgi:hypothetical protein